jgi:hypothetical protein
MPTTITEHIRPFVVAIGCYCRGGVFILLVGAVGTKRVVLPVKVEDRISAESGVRGKLPFVLLLEVEDIGTRA